VKPPVTPLDDELWRSLCETDVVRPTFVAAGRARLASHDWPPPIAVADALIDWQLRLSGLRG
jgi:hypothetical protein